ncbi:MAG: enoyl-CoA hydratase/isomerase family protein [Bacteroidales bacterium]|nr:enoyl-CoA hydratase/isomerase family protein [Bacteroidota bacterium]MBL6949789.1 enoyl-CoA hydratase/isomerase family protein [Bacteroidales bacterium]
MESINRVEWEVREGIGIITLNNPPENYLYEPEFIPIKTLKKWTSNPKLKGLLIHGKGKHFSAGGDMTRLFEMIEEDLAIRQKMEAGDRVIKHLIELDLPMVAAIHGVCFGGGLELALACHIRIAGEQSLFALPETSHGLLPGLGGTVRLPPVVGEARSLQMILSGDMINSEEARLIKLIDFIVPRNEVFEYAYRLIHKMTGNLSIRVIRAVIRAFRNAATMPAEEAISEETRIFCELAREEAKRRFTKSDK